jgi:hypothetical protein
MPRNPVPLYSEQENFSLSLEKVDTYKKALCQGISYSGQGKIDFFPTQIEPEFTPPTYND